MRNQTVKFHNSGLAAVDTTIVDSYFGGDTMVFFVQYPHRSKQPGFCRPFMNGNNKNKGDDS